MIAVTDPAGATSPANSPAGGDLSKFAKGSSPAKSCTGSQVQVSFSGPLPSGCAEDDVLAWRSGTWTCAAVAGAPDAFVARRQGFAAIPTTAASTRLVVLSLLPGTYVVTAKTEIASQGTASDPPVDVHCELIPSSEDGTPGASGSTQNDFASRRLAPVGGTGASDGFVLFVTQRLTQPGSVVLGCSASGNTSGAAASYSSIRAVEVGSVTTSEFPGPLP